MKKTILILLLSLLIAGGGYGAYYFVTQQEKPVETTKLNAPVVTLSEDNATWNKIDFAQKYEISINGSLSYIESSITSKKLNSGETFKIRAIGDDTKYSNSDWSNSVTYENIVLTYKVTWKNGNTTLEVDENVEEGTNPSYDGDTPTKEDTAEYSYTFSGWSPEIKEVTADVTYTAQFTETKKVYTVTWKNGDIVLETDKNVEYGVIPTFDGITPTKEKDAINSYTFSGWSPEVKEVTGDVTYTAQFIETKNLYTVTWMNGDTVLETDENVKYGDVPSYDGAIPTKEKDAINSYKFSGWSPEIKTVTGDITYYAQFSINENTYTVTWKNGDKVVEIDYNVKYGQMPTFDSIIPTREKDQKYTYTFKGWSPEISIVTEDVTYEAVFIETINTYTVIWKNGDAVLETDANVKYGVKPTYNGATPTKPNDAENTYAFIGWSPEVSEVTKDVTYQAQFSATNKTYTVTWKNGDTVLEIDKDVKYGVMPTYDGVTPTKAKDQKYTYTFKGFSPEVKAVVGDVTYNAVYTETLNTYTITFYSEDGNTILDKKTVEYGSDVTYTKENPVKNSTEQNTYLFEKWVTEKGGNVTDDLKNVVENRNVYASFKEFVRMVTVFIAPNNVDYGTVSNTTLNNIPYGSKIEVNGNKITINGQVVSAQTSQSTAQYTYKLTNWTAPTTVGSDTTIIANFTRTVNTYTVTWKNGDTVLEVDKDVKYGELPVYNGKEPTKPESNEFKYVFSGWSPTISQVTGDVTYEAQYLVLDNEFTVKFYDDNGILLATVLVKKGGNAVYPHSTPEKVSTVSKVFTFEKWVTTNGGSTTADLTNILINKEVYAKYTSVARKYKVTFTDWDGKVLEEQTVAYGSSATTPQSPYRDGYRFDKWNVAYNYITSDLKVTATYIREYKVTFVDYDNSIISIQHVEYGKSAIKPVDPKRVNYVFDGWNTTFTNIVTDITVKAQYTRLYTVTFVDYDGNVLSTQSVKSGSGATKPSDPTRTGYKFKSWSAPYNNITEDIEIIAQYEINRYTVKFVYADGSVISTINNVAYGTTVIAPKTKDMYFDWSTTKGYKFTGWKDWTTDDPIVSNRDIVALYNDEITEPIIAIESVTITKGTTSANVSVYLCGNIGIINGIVLKLKYSDGLTLEQYTNKLTAAELSINKEKHLYELSWADGKEGTTITERLEIATLTFNVDKFSNVDAYSLEITEDTYIINNELTKIEPIIVVGQITIVK